jgi:integrase
MTEAPSPSLRLEPAEIAGVRLIKASIPKAPVLIEKIKRIKGRQWSQQHSAWLLPLEKEVWAAFQKEFRDTLLSPKLLEQLEIYFQHFSVHYWLFEGQDGGQYSARSVQNILRAAVEKSGVNPFATVHTLRHSFATHLLNNGISLRHIQELLGHESSKTTEIYTHLTGDQLKKVESPLDKLNF